MRFGLLIGLLGASGLPQYFGEDTPLRKAIEAAPRSRIHTSHIWTHANQAVVVVLYPEPLDFRVEDSPPGHLPWRPSWISALDFPEEKAKQVVKGSTIVLVLREQDGNTCLVNELAGERIVAEDAKQQDATAVEMLCEQIWNKFGTLGLPESEQRDVKEYLKTPPAPPKFKRKRNPNVIVVPAPVDGGRTTEDDVRKAFEEQDHKPGS